MLPNIDWLIIANGEPMPKEKLLKLAQNKSVMVLDGAINTALDLGLQPLTVIGDFDSINIDFKETLSEISTIRLIEDKDQNSSDLQKGLNYLKKLNPKSVTLVNATGLRMDHTLYNLRLLKRFHSQIHSLSLVTNLEIIHYIENQEIALQSQQREPTGTLGLLRSESNEPGPRL